MAKENTYSSITQQWFMAWWGPSDGHFIWLYVMQSSRSSPHDQSHASSRMRDGGGRGRFSPAGLPSVYLKLLEATYEVQSLGKRRPAKSHLGPDAHLIDDAFWWINLSAPEYHSSNAGGEQHFKYSWPFRVLILFPALRSSSLAFPDVQTFICHHAEAPLPNINATSF